MGTQKNKIEYGDKIYATITSHNGTIITHITTESINSVKELMLKVRAETYNKQIRLSNLKIRNYTQGWSIQQPLLYT